MSSFLRGCGGLLASFVWFYVVWPLVEILSLLPAVYALPGLFSAWLSSFVSGLPVVSWGRFFGDALSGGLIAKFPASSYNPFRRDPYSAASYGNYFGSVFVVHRYSGILFESVYIIMLFVRKFVTSIHDRLDPTDSL